MLSFAANGGNPELPPGREFKPGLPGSARSKSATGRPAGGAQGHPDDARRPSEDVGLGHAGSFRGSAPAADAEIPLESHPGYRPRCEPATAGNAAAAGPCLTASSSTSACFSSSANSAPRRRRHACCSRAGSLAVDTSAAKFSWECARSGSIGFMNKRLRPRCEVARDVGVSVSVPLPGSPVLTTRSLSARQRRGDQNGRSDAVAL